MKLQLSLRNSKQVNNEATTLTERETVNNSTNESAAANESKHVSKQGMSIMTNEHSAHTASILGSKVH